MEKELIKGKRRARKLALQALYQWLMTNHELYEIETQFRVANDMAKVDADYFCRILYGVPANLNQIEEAISPFLDRQLTSVNPVELSILRLGAFELFFCPEIPYKVVLDEAITLAKDFGAQEGYRYVNGVLNSVAKQTRSVEIDLNHE
ncbi:transcription antitermination factor NusB [Legionella dresdenensis]|uniref:Transcription antitermination protein NusB n=1 Tax=Legionella dresdenensis TaxID=450200 RepID=A0ABV8CER3_9GAMM